MDISAIIVGLSVGSLYALVAISFNIIYLPTNVFNFAQGDLAVVGALVGGGSIVIGVPWVLALLLAMAATAGVALIEERIAVGPVLRRSTTSTAWIITTLAFSIILIGLITRIAPPTPVSVPTPPLLSLSTFEVGQVRMNSYHLTLIFVGIAVTIAATCLYKTLVGRAVRAVAEDREAAILRGISPHRLVLWSFIAGGAVAGAAGLLAAPMLTASTSLSPLMLILGFQAAALGGVGSNVGALAAGYVIGVAQSVSATLLSPGYQNAVTLGILLSILLVRPQGLVGRKTVRTV